MRFRVSLRKWFRDSLTSKTIKKFFSRRITINPFEEKAVKLWKILLRDPSTKMAYNSYGARQVEKENIFIIFQPAASTDYIMTIMDVTDTSKNLYELHISEGPANNVMVSFDSEMERRMRRTESSKRWIIQSDIDRLIEKEEAKTLIGK